MIIKAKLVLINKELVPNQYVVVESGKITNILDSSPKYDVATDILAPGFIDNHCHGFGGHDFMESTNEAYKIILESMAQNGTTSVFATSVTQSEEKLNNMFDFVSKYKSNPKEASILGIHSEGPFISKCKKGAQPEEHIKTGTVELIENMHKVSRGSLKVMTYAPEHDLNNNLVKAGNKLVIKMQIGHCKASEDEVKVAVANGAQGVTHAYNGMPKSLVGETTGFVARENIYAEIICDGIHNSAKEIEEFIKLKGKDKVILITDALMCAGMPDGDYQLGGQDITKKGLSCTIKGTDTKAGSVASMLDVVKTTIELTSNSLADALVMATENVANYHNLQNKGKIKENYDADLICLNEDLSLSKTIINGEIVYED